MQMIAQQHCRRLVHLARHATACQYRQSAARMGQLACQNIHVRQATSAGRADVFLHRPSSAPMDLRAMVIMCAVHLRGVVADSVWRLLAPFVALRDQPYVLSTLTAAGKPSQRRTQIWTASPPSTIHVARLTGARTRTRRHCLTSTPPHYLSPRRRHQIRKQTHRRPSLQVLLPVLLQHFLRPLPLFSTS